jgi:UDP-N-acetylmuramyl pentapeptide phosphotransferase/UDP-N-acetylglucosamine-1-phosphate transferase
MLDVLLTGSVSFIVTFLAIPIVLQIAEEKKLFDLPDERKIHKIPVPSLGGVGIFGGFLLAALLSISAQKNPEFQYFFAASIVIFFIGLKDDIIVLSATKKFIGQVIAASILIHLGDIRITSMHGLFGFTEISVGFSYALSYLTIIVVMNSFNLIDGVDGLAGTLGLLTMILFGSYFYAVGMFAYSLLAFALGGSLLAFLIFNHHPAKIFMGDSGSLMIGLVNAILVIKFITVANPLSTILPIQSEVAVAFAILMIPLLDTLRVFSIRIFKGNSPFTPDRNHVHHLLLDRGFKHTGVTFFCLFLNIGFITLAYFGQQLGPTKLLLVLLSIAFSGLAVLYYYKRAKPTMFIAKHLDEEISTAPKVVTLTKETAIVEQQ